MISKISLMHRGIGTAYFYMAGIETISRDKKIEYLFRSCQSHWSTIVLYRDHEFDQETIGTIENYNRFSGSVIGWINASNASLDEKVTFESIGIGVNQTSPTKTVGNWIEDIYGYMRETFAIYKKTELYRTPEIISSLERLLSLSEEVIKNKQSYDQDTINKYIQINNAALDVVTNNLKVVTDKCTTLADELKNLNKKLSN